MTRRQILQHRANCARCWAETPRDDVCPLLVACPSCEAVPGAHCHRRGFSSPTHLRRRLAAMRAVMGRTNARERRKRLVSAALGTLTLSDMRHPNAFAPAPSDFAPDLPEDLNPNVDTSEFEEELDVFGHYGYVRALESAITEAEAPFTFGLFGDWGVGKSTILRSLAARLGPGHELVTFDAWRYEGVALRRHLLRTVATELHRRGAVRGFDPKRELLDLDVDVTQARDRARLSRPGVIRLVLTAAAVGGVAYAGLRAVHGSSLVAEPKFSVFAAISAGVATVTLIVTVLRETLLVAPDALSRKRVEEPDRFSEKFARLLASVTSRRVVIAIDNLDRCEPAEAVALLSTIKTYLEPATEDQHGRARWTPWRRRRGTSAVFVIAADDGALRRQVLATEPGLLRDGVGAQNPHRYVDEYLRKFFNATMRVRRPLTSDMRSYVHAALAQFLHRWRPDDEDYSSAAVFASATQMTAAVLRDNPRRLKQFVNSLHLELRLIEAREHAGEIHPPVSGRLATIVMLALIRDEWHDAYRLLEDDPMLLATWQGSVRAGHELQSLPCSVPGAEFTSFLGLCPDVSGEPIEALLSLKREPSDESMPGLSELRSALREGNSAKVDALLGPISNVGAERDRRWRYLRRVPDLFHEEFNDSPERAARIAAAVMGANALSDAPKLRSAVLAEALSLDTVEDALAGLPPSMTLGRLGALAADDARAVTEVVVGRVLAGAGNVEQATEIGRLVADDPAFGETAPAGVKLRELLSEVSPGSSVARAATAMIRAAPSLLPRDLFAAAEAELESAAASPGSARANEVRNVLVLGAAVGARGRSIADRIVEVVVLLRERPEAVAWLVESAISLRLDEEVPHEQFRDLAFALQSTWQLGTGMDEPIAPEAKPHVVALLGALSGSSARRSLDDRPLRWAREAMEADPLLLAGYLLLLESIDSPPPPAWRGGLSKLVEGTGGAAANAWRRLRARHRWT